MAPTRSRRARLAASAARMRARTSHYPETHIPAILRDRAGQDPTFGLTFQELTCTEDPVGVPVDPTFDWLFHVNRHYQDPPLYLALRLRLRDQRVSLPAEDRA
jgi:hypothetical protein